MADNSLPGGVEDPGRVFSTESIGSSGKESLSVPNQSFTAFMQKGAAPTPMETAGKSSTISPFSLMQGQPPVATTPSLDTLMTQVKNVHSTLGDINTQLNTPNLKLKASTKYLVKNKLTDANEHLRSFNERIGAEVPKQPDASKFSGPLGRFFAYLNDGQAQMEQAKIQLQNLKEKGTNMSPSDFLLVQIKMNKAQQLLEFTSVLLSNAVSVIKQIMQVQR